MDWNGLIIVIAVGMMVLINGWILLAVHHHMAQARERRIMCFIDKEITVKVKRVAMEILNEGMDMMPEKIADVKRTIEGE